MKICTIIGARPQFIKAAAVSAKLVKVDGFEEVIIHTGQHYDPEMSEIFFRELNIPEAKYCLEIGSGLHGEQTGKMLTALEGVLIEEKPDLILIYGDTNSTLAGALAAAKLHIPGAHVEAGMRSFNRKMPEEINRIVADHLCEINFCSTDVALNNLKNEGLGNTLVLVGDVMYDGALVFADLAEKQGGVFEKLGIKPGEYILMTCHRAENTDDPSRLTGIVEAVNQLAVENPILFPIHPRTKKYLAEYSLKFTDQVKVVPPVSYLEMILLEKKAQLILTDSGGIQKEAFFYQVPCVTMRDETEWLETVKLGWNLVVGANQKKIINAVKGFLASRPAVTNATPYGNGDAVDKIIECLRNYGNVK